MAAASSIAIGKGHIHQTFDGTAVTLRNLRHSDRREIREAHYDHTAPNSFREGGNVPPIWAKSRGTDISVLGLLAQDRYEQVVTLPTSDIETPADLRGRRVGLLTRPLDLIDYQRADDLAGYHDLVNWLGWEIGDLQLVGIAADEALVAKKVEAGALGGSGRDVRMHLRNRGYKVRALIDGRVDAVRLAGPEVEIAHLLGLRVVVDLRETLPEQTRVRGSNPLVLTVRSELEREYPDVVTRYLVQLLRTARWAATDRHSAISQIARDVGVGDELVPLVYNDRIHEQLVPTTDAELIDRLRRQKDFLFAEGFLAGDFDVDSWVDPAPLQRATAALAAETA